MKQFVEALGKEGDCFKYLSEKFPGLSDAKPKEGVFVCARVGVGGGGARVARPPRPPPPTPTPPSSPRGGGWGATAPAREARRRGGPITLAPAREARRRERIELGRKPRGARPAFFPPLLTPPTSYHFSPHHIPTIAHARPHLIPSTPNDVDTRGARSSTFSTTTPVIQSSPAILNQKQCTIRRGAKFEMASNTQELNNAVASIMPMTEQEKASTSRVRCRSTSPDLFEEEEEVRPVKKVCQRPAAKVGPISKYRATCNRTNPYAGSCRPLQTA
ncbi:uncharacterized protein [Leptinotarsa decemlineata]|uniref:uncharacterized protein n=1 Tax=Leptinotarsa decemlineata TaxID=7539 RepID=UPI003D3090B0